MIPTILAIAGSDPTGGAGIQADLKTLTSLGVYGAAAITCLTVQNSHGVNRIEPLAPDLIRGQINAVLEDHWVSHIKIGMVGTVEIAKCLGEIASNFTGHVIYDPVLAATSGQDLLEPAGVEALQQYLLPYVTVLTPNLPELSALTGKTLCDENELRHAAGVLLQHFPRLERVLVKGGHGRIQNQQVTDYCMARTGYRKNVHTYINTKNSHGTGCTFASAFSAFHLKTSNYEKSFTFCVNYMQTLIRASAKQEIVQHDTGKGPMLHGAVSCTSGSQND